MGQTKDAARLREAIQYYRARHSAELDEHADKLLKRLADSPKAAAAFDELKPKDDKKYDDELAAIRARQQERTRAYLERLKEGNPEVVKVIEQRVKAKDDSAATGWEAAFIRACIEAENLHRTFLERVEKAKARWLNPERSKRCEAIATLRGFLGEIISEQQELAAEAAEDIAAMGLGLATFERWIEYERDLAGLNLFRMRASQKTKSSSKALSAGQIAAIGRLTDDVSTALVLASKPIVEHTGKRPRHYKAIADLAGVILKRQVFVEQVRDTQPRRGHPAPHWQWVVHHLSE